MALEERELEVMARRLVPVLLAEALGTGPSSRPRARLARGLPYDFTVAVENRMLLVDVLGRAERAPLLHHWERVKKARTNKSQVAVVVVPYMTEPARKLCDEHQINWMDLSGNASIHANGFHLRLSGNPNRFTRPGRPSSVFERRSSRVARTLLQFPGRHWSLREIARAAGLNEGHVSRILARLVEDDLLARDERRRFRVPDPALLLEAWRESAAFSKHRVLRGHVPARSGEELLHLLSTRLDEIRLGHAATGLGAAWLYDHFAMFRLVTFYVSQWPTPEQFEHLHFREEPSGANAWLAVPNDEGVFSGSGTVDGVQCVHPVQVYVDLKDQPERAAEASQHFRSNPLLLGDAHGP